MAKGVDARSERQELVTRFFVYSDRYHDFRHDVRRFLDIAMDKLNKTACESDISRMRDEFIRTMKFISANFPSACYRPDGGRREIGRAHVCTKDTNAQLVCRLLLETTTNTPYANNHTQQL